MSELAPTTVEGAPTPPAAPGPAPITAIPAPEAGHAYFVDPDGQLGTVPNESAQAAAEQGFKPATDAQVYAHLNGTFGAVTAGAIGAGRGASFGLLDPALVAGAGLLEGDKGREEMRRSLDLERRGYSTASTIGEFGGALAPLMLGAPPVAAAGEGIAARVAAGIPRLAAEGAAFSTGEQLTEDTLGNHDLVAQKYLSAAVEGGILNVLIGSGLHGAGALLAEGISARGAAAAARAGEEEGSKVAAGSFGSKLADTAETQAAKSMLPASTLSGAEMNKLGRTAEEQATRLQEIGRTALEEKIVSPLSTKPEMAKRAIARVGQVGEDLASIRKGLEKSAVRPSTEGVINGVRGIAEELNAQPFAQADRRAVAPFVEELLQRSGAVVTDQGEIVASRPAYKTFAELGDLRIALDKRLEQMRVWAKFNGEAPGHEALKSIRGILEGEYEKAAGAAANDLGEDVLTKYRTTKALFQDLKTIEKWTTKGAAREGQHRAISLTDTIAAGAGLATGHALGGIALGAANKVMRTFGNQMAATAANRVSKLMGVQRATAAFDRRLEKAVQGFYSGKKAAKSVSAASPDISPETARTLRDAVKNPAALTDRVAAAVGAQGFSSVAPKIAQAMSNTILRAATYLSNRLPPEPAPAGFSFGPTKPRAIGPYAQSQLNSVVGALNMDGVLADIERGRADRQKIEALRIINPDAHAAIIKALMDHGQQAGAELTHQQEVALSILGGQPVGAIMQPKTIRGFQQAHAQAGPDPTENNGPKPKAVGRPSQATANATAQSYQSGTQRLEANGI